MTEPTGLRFAMVTTFYPPHNFGGDGMYIRRLAHSLARRGHTVDIIHDVDAYLVGGGKDQDSLPEPDGVTTHPLRSGSALLSTLATQQLGRPLVHGKTITKILSRGFDVIHYHNISLVGGPGVLALGEGIKLYTAHEHWLVCPTHILWRYGREPCDERKCLSCVLQARRPPQLWRNTKLLENQATHVDEFLALSEFSAQKHRDFGFPAPMTVFPSFLPDAEDGGPAENAPKQNDDTEMSESALPYFLFVGRLEPIKGLVDVIPRFTDDMPAELWIVGSGTQEEELKKLAKGRKNVKFLGRKTPSELRSLYRDARALIASSRCFEVFPLVLLEAFREGTPTIARDLGPYPEIVHQANAGLLFSDDDSLDRALRQLATDAKLRNDLGESGARAFAERWSEDVVMEKYLATIRKHAERRDLSGTLARLNRSP